MKEMTATEVARNFSAVLNAVESGEEIVIYRGKVEIARMTPASTKAPNGKAIIDFVEDLAKSGNLAAGDNDFEQAMHAVLERRSSNRVVREDPWRE